MTVIRVTMFKIPNKESQQKMLENYRVLSKSAVKGGKPYILSLQAGPTFSDLRAQGYTLVAKSEFESVEDMVYYDDECEAHHELKVKGESLGIQGVMMVYYKPEVISTL